MRIGTYVHGMLLVESNEKESHNMDLETALSVQLSSLKTAINGEGLELYSLGEKRFPQWPSPKGTIKQIRQDFTLIITKSLTREEVYGIINQVRPQPLKFRK